MVQNASRVPALAPMFLAGYMKGKESGLRESASI